jgi:ubiquinone/menaquinone biosynthesis C-methylase UbiE
MNPTIEEVRAYWDSHLNCTQFLSDVKLPWRSEEFYRAIETYIGEHHAYKKNLLADLLKKCNGKKLLEVGCGLGVELAWLGCLGFEVTGIDLSPTAVNLANQHLSRRKINGQASVQNVEHLEFPDETFDAVYSSGVLQHTPDMETAIHEIMRVLKPGGSVLVILYHRRSWFYMLHRLTGVKIEFSDEDAPIIKTFTKKEVEILFKDLRNRHITLEYFYPRRTAKRGVLALLFNYIFVPGARVLPHFLVKRFGWHIVLTGIK